MESTAEQVKDIISKTGDVIETKVKLVEIKSNRERIGSCFFHRFQYSCYSVYDACAVVFLSIGLAILIGQWLGEIYYGFLIMAGIYGLAGLLFYSLPQNAY